MRILRWLVILGAGALVVGGFILWRQQHAQAQRDEALAEARGGAFEAAELRLKAVLESAPNDVEVLRVLARGYLAMKRLPEAEEMLSRWLAEQPEDVAALRLRRDLYRDLHKYESAWLDAEQIVRRDPEQPADRMKLAGLSFTTGRFKEAERACLEFLEQSPNDRAAQTLLAEAYRALGEPVNAARVLDEVLAAQPSNVSALVTRATIYDEAGKPDQAIPLFKRALELDSRRQRSVLYSLSLALARAGKLEEAEVVSAKVRQMQEAEVFLEDSERQPRNTDLHVRAARALLKNGNSEEALRAVERALAVDPHYAPAHAFLAEHYEQVGDKARAAEHRRRAQR